MKVTEKTCHYHSIEYNSKERFNCYWHQINEILLLNPQEVLEIGIGNSFVSDFLKKKKVKVKTLDIDVRLNPDIVGNVLDLPFSNDTFYVVACYELLEHLPYNYFQEALIEILRVSKNKVILSLPDITPVYRFHIELPRMSPIRKLIRHPFRKTNQQKSYEGHYWEIGNKEFPLKKICNDVVRCGLNILKTYRIFEGYRHRIFLLEKA